MLQHAVAIVQSCHCRVHLQQSSISPLPRSFFVPPYSASTAGKYDSCAVHCGLTTRMTPDGSFSFTLHLVLFLRWVQFLCPPLANSCFYSGVENLSRFDGPSPCLVTLSCLCTGAVSSVSLKFVWCRFGSGCGPQGVLRCHSIVGENSGYIGLTGLRHSLASLFWSFRMERRVCVWEILESLGRMHLESLYPLLSECEVNRVLRMLAFD